MKNRRSKKVYFVFSIFSFIAFFLIAEAFLHLSNMSDRVGGKFSFHVRNVDNDLRHDYNVECPFLLWRPRPGKSKSDSSISINQNGFRDREYGLEKPPHTWRMLALGDSSTFGVGVDLDQTYHEVLERRLNREFGDSGWTFEVINGGVTGFTSYQCLGMYEQFGVRYEPDVVTLYAGINDLFPE